MQIFVSILESSGIKCIVKHNGHILAVKTVEYPGNKSSIYIQGIIEQEVNDYLISFKNYINNSNIKVCIIFLAGKALNLLLNQSAFNGHQIICISPEELFDSQPPSYQPFSDIEISQLFTEQKSFLGLNQTIKSITTLNFINSVMFKPLIVIIIMILFLLATIRLTILENQRKTLSYYKQNYQIINKYNNIRQKFPYIHNEVNAADIFSLETLLKMKTAKPFDHLEKLLLNLKPSITVDTIRWELQNHNNMIYPKESFKIDLLVKFTDNNDSLEKTNIDLDAFVNSLKEDFEDFEINYVKFLDKSLSLSKCTTIPVAISITGPHK